MCEICFGQGCPNCDPVQRDAHRLARKKKQLSNEPVSETVSRDTKLPKGNVITQKEL